MLPMTTVRHKTTVKHKKIGSFSGPYIYGKRNVFPHLPNHSNSHLERAFWLTTMVESGGKTGTIMGADGTGITASLEQLPAVYPRNMQVQGPLFKMLRRIDLLIPVTYWLPFRVEGWTLAHDGVLRYRENGEPVPPRVIRNTFTPNAGKVPKTGKDWEQAKKWAIYFHDLFSLDTTIPIQIKYGIEKFCKFAQRYRTKHLNKETVEELLYNGNVMNPQPFEDDPVMDLAMCMWWNYHVNSPTTAIKKMRDVLISHSGPDLGSAIIRELRASRYGRWGTNRYDRTREHAMKVWPKELFEKDGPMPARRK
jgi:hypothetical protein